MDPVTEHPTSERQPADGKVWTAEELFALPIEERFEIVRQGIVTDIDEYPPHMLEAARAAIRDHIAENESTDNSDQ